MPLTVRFIGALRHFSGKKQLTVGYQQGISVKELIANITQTFPQFQRTFSDQPLDDAKSNSLVLINGREISVLNGYETVLQDGDEVVLVPVVHGG